MRSVASGSLQDLVLRSLWELGDGGPVRLAHIIEMAETGGGELSRRLGHRPRRGAVLRVLGDLYDHYRITLSTDGITPVERPSSMELAEPVDSIRSTC